MIGAKTSNDLVRCFVQSSCTCNLTNSQWKLTRNPQTGHIRCNIATPRPLYWIPSQKKKAWRRRPATLFPRVPAKVTLTMAWFRNTTTQLNCFVPNQPWPSISLLRDSTVIGLKDYSPCDTSPATLDFTSLVKIVYLWTNWIIHATAPWGWSELQYFVCVPSQVNCARP